MTVTKRQDSGGFGTDRGFDPYAGAVKILRHLPWVSEPWSSEDWRLGRWSTSGVWWYNPETGQEVHAWERDDGWMVVATPDDDAPSGRTFQPELTPELTDRDTAVYLAEQYMKNGVGLVNHEKVESLNPPRLVDYLEEMGEE